MFQQTDALLSGVESITCCDGMLTVTGASEPAQPLECAHWIVFVGVPARGRDLHRFRVARSGDEVDATYNELVPPHTP